MNEYNIMNADDDELIHYGVLGMKWGRRKAKYEGVSTDSSKKIAYTEAQKKLAAARSAKKSANKAFSKAYKNNNSIVQDLQFDKANNKRRFDAVMDTYKKAVTADKKYKAAKKALKVARKAANIEAKAVKQKYRDQYMKGASKAGKIYAKLTNADKYYAEMMYDLNKGRYKEN